ncbi:MAG: hypothetical protein ABSF31_07035 [Steroidobacteraceae bacterium]
MRARRYIARSDAKSGAAADSRAQMPPQQRGDNPNRLQKRSAHPQQADLKGQTELELRPPALLDDPALRRRNLEEHLDPEGRYLARQVPKPQKCRVPAVHRGPLQTGTVDPASKDQLRLDINDHDQPFDWLRQCMK